MTYRDLFRVSILLSILLLGVAGFQGWAEFFFALMGFWFGAVIACSLIGVLVSEDPGDQP